MAKLPTIDYNDLTSEIIKEYGISFWGQEHEERLTHTDIEDAIEMILDDTEDYQLHLPQTVVGWKPLEVDPKHLCPLESVLEYLDDEYGDHEADLSEPTEKMKQAEEVFIKAIIEEYTPWACEPVLEVKLTDPLAWIEKNRPSWYEELKKP